MALNGPILAELQQEAKTTRKLLERVPEDALAWQPHKKSMPLGRLASHITELFGLTPAILTTDEIDYARGDYKPFMAASVKELLELFDKNMAATTEMLKSQDDQKLLATWRLRKGEQIYFEMPRVAILRTLVMSHIIHHRGQLSVYLRMRDVPLPSIYGPSADEPTM